MFGPLGFGQANAIMPGRFAQPQQMPGMGLPQMGQRFAPPASMMPQRAGGGFPGMMGGGSSPMSMMPQQGWMSSPFFRGGGMSSGALQLGRAVGPQLGSAASGVFGGGMQQRPTVGIPEQPNMPGMPQQLGPAYGRGRFGGGGFR